VICVKITEYLNILFRHILKSKIATKAMFLSVFKMNPSLVESSLKFVIIWLSLVSFRLIFCKCTPYRMRAPLLTAIILIWWLSAFNYYYYYYYYYCIFNRLGISKVLSEMLYYSHCISYKNCHFYSVYCFYLIILFLVYIILCCNL